MQVKKLGAKMSGNVRSSYNTSATKSNVGVTKPRGGSRAKYTQYF